MRRAARLLGYGSCVLTAPGALPGCSIGLQHAGRSFASKGKGSSTPPAAAGKQPATLAPAAGEHAAPVFTMKRVPRAPKVDAAARLSAEQRQLLEQLAPGEASVRSLRRLGWPLGSEDVLALLHHQMSETTGSAVHVLPFVLSHFHQSAASLAALVKELVSEGKGMQAVQQFLLTSIASLPPGSVPFEGVKVQLKGRMSGKGGKASKRVWEWGRTSTATLADPVDYGSEAVITRAGYIGIKVWVRYKRSHVAAQKQRSTRSPVSLSELLAKPVPQLQSRSKAAWWAQPGPQQPGLHRAQECWVQGFDPLATAAGQPAAEPANM